MNQEQLVRTAHALVGPGKGILAADESAPTIAKRFAAIGVESTADSRRDWRELLFTTRGLGSCISGVILFDETIRQRSASAAPLTQLLTEQGILPGIKVDAGKFPLAGSEREFVTEGLDGLRGRFAEYRELGARFSKWRAVIRIGEDAPSRYCLRVNAHALARFAALSQAEGLVPIVEPEVLMDGAHTIERCFEVTQAIQEHVYHELAEQRVFLEGTLLKPNMVVPGQDGPDVSAERVARETLRCFRRSVPAAVPGVVFLSGGMSEEVSAARLDAINRLARAEGAPWELSFSFGRGLQASALKAWAGRAEQRANAQAALLERARAASAARRGDYASEAAA